ncbi:hypothetical protein Ahy_A06g030067 isoform D [Arachis hypogaea]|uniref:Uncharacterized protein n=1 Tax=Arachis hypogaea TaxID=3818 RepID=A0A445CV61_ARAHY|nr:hypothetical protein Ahy_A06g030067 isoform D [Arachis hypogaea]
MRKLIHTLSNVSGDRLVSYVQEKVVTRMRQKIVQDVKIVQTNRNQQPRMKLLLHVHTPIRRFPSAQYSQECETSDEPHFLRSFQSRHDHDQEDYNAEKQR